MAVLKSQQAVSDNGVIHATHQSVTKHHFQNFTEIIVPGNYTQQFIELGYVTAVLLC